MCSIIGYCSPEVPMDKFKAGFAQTVSRGPDMTRTVDTGAGILGFHRLAIMGLHPEGMQPFRFEKNHLVCNGEIYGFAEIRPFPPGHYYKGGEFICYRDLTKVEEFCKDGLDTVCANIHNKLVAGIRKRLVADAKVSFFSAAALTPRWSAPCL